MKRPWLAIAIVLGAMCLSPLAVRAQRVEFPNPVSTPYLPPSGLPSPASGYAAAVPPPPTFDPYSIPSTPPPTMSAPYLSPGTPYPTAPVVPTTPYAPAAPYTYGGSPAALYPEGVPVYNGPFEPFTSTWTKTMRFFQEIHADETWEARGSGDRSMGINTINTWATFAIPFGWTPNPLLVTPGFQLNLWDGPDATGVPPPTLPGQTYGAYIDTAWNPQISNWFGAELEASPGVYTDFSHTNNQSIRILGRGVAVLTATPTLQFKAGVWYIDRLDIKLLPAAGIVWTPNPASRYEIFFPAPKLAHLWSTVGNVNLWLYIRGEYGGGAWTVERPVFGGNDQFEYDDLRVATGIDFLPETQSGLRGYLEVGFAFDRHLVFRSGMPGDTDLNNTVLIGGGLSY